MHRQHFTRGSIMQQSTHRRALIPAAVAVALMAWSHQASAAGFALFEQNASGLGNAFAGAAAVAEDAGTIYFNPAGMTRIRGRQVVGAVSVIDVKIDFENDGRSTVPLGQIPGGGNGGDAGGTAGVPAGYLSRELKPNTLWLGVGVSAPFGLSTEWKNGWVGRFHALESSVEAININPSIARKVNDQLSLGAGVSFQRLKATFSNAVPYTALAGSLRIPGVPIGSEGVAEVEGDSWDTGWNSGATRQVTPATRLGLAYRSKVKHDVEGDVNFSARPAPLARVVPDGDVKAKVELPDTLSLAVAHDVDARWQLLADYTRTGWSSIEELAILRPTGRAVSRVDLAFEDSWRIALGANYRMDDRWTLRFGFAYDRTPVQDAKRTPRLPDMDRKWLSVGTQYRASQALAFDVGFTYIFSSDASSNLASASAGNLTGSYSNKTRVLGGQVRYTF
ncbi:MAG: outer membrane protein transport protein [Burkholderiaceae bacterium]|nr:outer membrane protein transport protein [Burkholderiaceae bacterium]